MLRNFLVEAEVAPLEVIYDRFMRAEIKVPGADFCDMSATKGMKDLPLSEFQIINAMLPRKYYPPLAGNVYERRSASVARQLFPGTRMDIDYDQLLDKRPNKPGAVFAWHQDMVRRRVGAWEGIVAAAADPDRHPRSNPRPPRHRRTGRRRRTRPTRAPPPSHWRWTPPTR